MAIQAGFMNSGQACVAGTRILVPEHRLAELVCKANRIQPCDESNDHRPGGNLRPGAVHHYLRQ